MLGFRKSKVVVFFAHFRIEGGSEAHRMQRRHYKKEVSDFFDWIDSERKELEKTSGKPCVITNCCIIR